MSTHLPGDSLEAREPITAQGLRDYFREGAKPRADWRIGAEFEKFALHRGTGKQVNYWEAGGIATILPKLAEQFHWDPHHEGGHLTTLSREGSTISLEPGGQLEFSTPPLRDLHFLAADYRRHVAEIREIVDRRKIAWVGLGVTPVSTVESIPLGPRQRHLVMSHYLPTRCPRALHMMKATCSTQVTFDYADEADAIRKVSTALRLGPIANGIWGNSPFLEGKPSGWQSFRGHIWQGMDPDRSGQLEELLQRGFNFETWIDYLLDVPMLFRFHAGEYLPAEGKTFRQFMSDGIDGEFPSRFDWELHITTVFPDVRLKQFLEVRGADATAPELALAVPAFWKGLLYDDIALSAAAELAQSLPLVELPQIAGSVYRHGLNAIVEGRTVGEWCAELTALAEAGLHRQAAIFGIPDESRFLEPIQYRLDRKSAPWQWQELIVTNEY